VTRAAGTGRGRFAAVFVATIAFSAMALQTETAWGAARKEYAYLLVQGSISDPSGGRPLIGATVRLSSGSLRYETITDGRGAVVFEKLPVASYEMTVTDTDGDGVESFEPVGLDASDARRFRIRFGTGEPVGVCIDAAGKDVHLVAPEPPARWRRFWAQFAIFGGCALILAL